ncbi:hypothetical protein ABEB36_000273 [Hypothenemus hampei]|uniref:Regulatory protein zeste n=1 Tax=Hypothenemus hampei TaxID=57062 RepID=A0ABD1FDC9_HYPHA
MDQNRVTRQNECSQSETKKARKARQEELQATNELYEAEEGLLYGAGIAEELCSEYLIKMSAFIAEEKNFLVSLIEQYKNVIENKKTDANSNRAKAEA